MSRYWSSLVHGLTPYVPGEQPKMEGIVKLNTNENPYPPSPRVAEAVTRELTNLRLYPDPTGAGLRAALALHHGVTPDQVFVGNGSDEVLAHAFLGLLKHEQPLLFPDITYSFYPVYCGLYGIAFETIALDQRFQVNVADYARPCGGIILPNPNAPTGIALPLEGIETLLRAHPDAVVVVDEAYVDFGADSAVALVARHPNLLVVQTFSKSRSLAGLRVGYAIGQRPLIEALERVKDSFNSYPLDRLALAGAAAAVEDDAWFRDTCARIIASRVRLEQALTDLGFEVLPSAANFLFARHPRHAGADLARALRDRAIVVRHFAKPRIADHLRITIGTEAQCERLAAALADILRS